MPKRFSSENFVLALLTWLLLGGATARAESEGDAGDRPQIVVEMGQGELTLNVSGLEVDPEKLEQWRAEWLVADEFRSLVLSERRERFVIEGPELEALAQEFKAAQAQVLKRAQDLVSQNLVGGKAPLSANPPPKKEEGLRELLDRWRENATVKLQDLAHLLGEEFWAFRQSFWPKVILAVMTWLLLFSIALVLQALVPQYLQRSLSVMNEAKAGAFMVGALLWLLLPAFSMLLVVSLVGITLLPLLFGVYAFLTLLGTMSVSLWIGQKFEYARPHPLGLTLALGVAMLFLLPFIPWVGGVLLVLLLLTGFGAAARALWRLV